MGKVDGFGHVLTFVLPGRARIREAAAIFEGCAPSSLYSLVPLHGLLQTLSVHLADVPLGISCLAEALLQGLQPLAESPVLSLEPPDLSPGLLQLLRTTSSTEMNAYPLEHLAASTSDVWLPGDELLCVEARGEVLLASCPVLLLLHHI